MRGLLAAIIATQIHEAQLKHNGRGVVPQSKLGKEKDLINFNSLDLENWLKQLATTYVSLFKRGQGAQ